MSTIPIKFIYDEDNKKIGVLLTAHQFDKLIEEVEDYHDYLLIKQQDGKEEKTYTFEEIMAEIEKEEAGK